MSIASLQGWGDESLRTVGVPVPAYLLGAVVADPAAADGIRDRLTTLPRRGTKLHWRDLTPTDRTRAVATIASFTASHVVVIGAPVDPRRQERARALCLERLAWELDQQGVQTLTLEARPQTLMRRDRQTIDALRGKRALPRGLRIEHALPSVEPMLWIADQVLGAMGEALRGDGRWFAPLRPTTSVITLAL